MFKRLANWLFGGSGRAPAGRPASARRRHAEDAAPLLAVPMVAAAADSEDVAGFGDEAEDYADDEEREYDEYGDDPDDGVCGASCGNPG